VQKKKTLLLTRVVIIHHDLKHWPPPADELGEDAEASTKPIKVQEEERVVAMVGRFEELNRRPIKTWR
jgi:hypothetical protein